MRTLSRITPLLVLAACASAPLARPVARPPRAIDEGVTVEAHGLANIQRTLRLLETSTPTHRNTVRILFYGQSITESDWSRQLEASLRRRYPYADLQVENRALGGHAAQLLIKAAESDLYPFYPDLMVLHVLGAHDAYEALIRTVRERTTTEVLHQTDHVFDPAELSEPTDPAKLKPEAAHWSAFMNHAFLPSLVARHQTTLCDQRAAWKQYLALHHLPPSALLRDEVHINARGDDLMAALVGRCLRYDPRVGPSPAEQWVRTYEVGRDLGWEGDTLTLPFEGNRVDVIVPSDAPASAVAEVRIDGAPPSTLPALYAFTRAHAPECGKWPPVFAPKSEAPLLLEQWTLTIDVGTGGVHTFSLRGTQTGEDGTGRSDQRFVSRSGRVVIEPAHWNLDYALKLAGTTPRPTRIVARLRVAPQFVDEVHGAPHDPAHERAVTVAQGLTPGPHVLTLRARGGRPVAALRVHRPPLTPAAASGPEDRSEAPAR
ncbi:MAG: SGNH/GDSL hydrolase family protein [Polyangiales bacterium]